MTEICQTCKRPIYTKSPKDHEKSKTLSGAFVLGCFIGLASGFIVYGAGAGAAISCGIGIITSIATYFLLGWLALKALENKPS